MLSLQTWHCSVRVDSETVQDSTSLHEAGWEIGVRDRKES